MIKLFRRFRKKKHTNELIDELDEMYKELKSSEKKVNQIEVIRKNQVKLAKELNDERQKSL